MNAVTILKEAINIIQKSNDVELVQKLIGAQQEVIDMEEQIYNLKSENRNLKDEINKKNNVERYRNIPIISLKEDNPKILYCANCYGAENKLIQLQVIDGNHCYCRNCKDQFNISYSPDADIIKKGVERC